MLDTKGPEIRLHDAGLNASKKEVITEDEEEVGIVLKQKKRPSSKIFVNAFSASSYCCISTKQRPKINQFSIF